jgi:hypothetical protein
VLLLTERPTLPWSPYEKLSDHDSIRSMLEKTARIRVGIVVAEALRETFEMSKVRTLDADSTVVQPNRMRGGIDISDKETLLVIGCCTETEKGEKEQAKGDRLARSRLKISVFAHSCIGDELGDGSAGYIIGEWLGIEYEPEPDFSRHSSLLRAVLEIQL